MAGHSQFKNIMHRKGAQDKKRGKQFTKIAHEIMTSVREGGGADSSANSRLRNALAAARQANIPKDNIERAIKRATGDGDGAMYEEIRYEGTYKDGIALIIESLTDNRNRAACEVRTILHKNGGALSNAGSLSFMFDRLGYIEYDASVASEDDLFMASTEAGAIDFSSEDGAFIIITEFEDFASVKETLSGRFGVPKSCEIIWRAKTPIEIPEGGELHRGIERLVEALEDSEDVQSVWVNI